LATDQIVKEQVFPFLQTNIIPPTLFSCQMPGQLHRAIDTGHLPTYNIRGC